MDDILIDLCAAVVVITFVSTFAVWAEYFS